MPRALDVRQEIVSQPRAGAGALDQARDVGDDELAFLAFDNTEDR